MSKKQVLAMTSLVALAVLGLLAVLVMNGLSHGANMFSGFMTVVVGMTFVTALVCVFSPFAVMVWYPEEGLASLAPPPEPASPAAAPSSDDDFDDDDDDPDDGGFDDEFEDDDEELYDDSGEFDEDEDW